MQEFIWNTSEDKFTVIVFHTEPGNLRHTLHVYKYHKVKNLQHKVESLLRYLHTEKKLIEGYINFYGHKSRRFIYRHYINVNIKQKTVISG